MSQPRNAYKRQQQAKRTARHQAKRREVRNAYRPRTTGRLRAMPVSRQPQRGLPKLVRGAIDRMIGRHKLLTMPTSVESEKAA
jgi:hypothetical protein